VNRDTVVYSSCTFLLGLVIGTFLIGPHVGHRAAPASSAEISTEGGAPQAAVTEPAPQNPMGAVLKQIAALKEEIARNPENAEALAAVDADPHWVHELSGRWFVVTQRAKLGIMRQVRSLRLPILQVEAGQDALIEADTNRRLFARIGSVQKRLLVLPGFYHDMELQRDLDPLVACIVEFLARNFTAVA